MKLRRNFIICIMFILCLSFTFTAVTVLGNNSMADSERKTSMKTTSPMDKKPEIIKVSEGEGEKAAAAYELVLDGDDWLLNSKSKNDWDGAYKISVPSSISGALAEIGEIKDPTVGLNDAAAKKLGEKDWYYKKTFTYNGSGKRVRLCFDGVADRMSVTLNGTKVGSHQGMFGGPYIDVTDYIVKGENTLIVHLQPVLAYQNTVVFNCSYAWHYADLPPIGIWNSVSVKDMEDVEIDHPFISTVSAETGTMDMSIDLVDLTEGSKIQGTLYCTIRPKNFEGTTYNFSYKVNSNTAGDTNVRVRFDLPEFKLWWPNGLGEQNLYTLETTFVSNSGYKTSTSSQFGIRSLEMIANGRRESTSMYNRGAVINGKEVFLKGANWCTIDATMHFTREDYDRILCRAKDQGLNVFRAWGGGMTECEAFYDLCDEYGLMVYQEWPCCWDSQQTQPKDILFETVIQNTKRLRNRASLLVYGGGNEGAGPANDSVLNKMGMYTYQYDGTRDFWRQDGGTGGAGMSHDHIHWGGETPEHYAMTYYNSTNNLHEYGLDAMMNMESIAKYATKEEMEQWPIDPKGTVAYHTATFNGAKGWNTTPYGYDIDTYIHYAEQFVEVDSLEDLVLGSQIAQTMADYLAIQNSRINFPNQSMVFYYKFNDVYPSGTWAVVDYYGAPKMAYWFIQDAFAPLAAYGKFDRYDTYNKANQNLSVPIYVIDETDKLAGKNWKAVVRAYDDNLKLVKTSSWDGSGSIDYSEYVGDFTLTAQQTDSSPLFIIVDIEVEGNVEARSYIFMNAGENPGRLTSLPCATLEYSISGNTVTIKNTSDIPAAGVRFICGEVSDTFRPDDNWFWMEPGETKVVKCNSTDGVTGITGFNVADTNDTKAPSQVTDITAVSDNCDSITLKWKSNKKDDGVRLYWIFVNDEPYAWVEGNENQCILSGLSEVTEYKIEIFAVDNGMNKSPASETLMVETMPDLNAPKATKIEIIDNTTIDVKFSRDILPESVGNLEYYLMTGGAKVTGASMGADARTVRLTVEGFSADNASDCKLTVYGVRDTSLSHNHAVRTCFNFGQNVSGYWALDAVEGIFFTDDSNSNESRGILGGGSWIEKGKYGGAIEVGAGDVCITSSDFALEDSTISFWIKLNSLDEGFHVFFAKGPKNAGHFEFYTNGRHLVFYSPDSYTNDMGVDMSPYVGEWINMTFVCNKKTLSVYINGEYKGKCGVGKITDETENFYIGSLPGGGFSTDAYIDEVYLISRPLEKEEIADLMNKTFIQDVCMDSACYQMKSGESKTAKVVYTGIPEGTYSFTWTSADESIATVDAEGKISGIADGETIITMTSSDGKIVEKAVVMVGDYEYVKPVYKTTPTKKGLNLGLVAGICGGVVLLAAAALIVVIKKKS